jgi:hypothetical protein
MRAAIGVDPDCAIFGSRIAVRWYRLLVNTAAGATVDAKQREQQQPVNTNSGYSHRSVNLSDLNLIGSRHFALGANLTSAIRASQ